MARGFLSGAILGTIVSVGGLGAVSVLVPDPGNTPPVVPEQIVKDAQPEIAETPQTQEDEAAELAPSDTPAAEPEPAMPDSEPVPDAPQEPSVSDSATAPESDIAVPEPASEISPETTREDAVPETAEAEPVQPARRPVDVTEVLPDAQTPELGTPPDAQDSAPQDTAAAPLPAPETGDSIAALSVPDATDAPDAPMRSTGDSAPQAPAAPPLDTPEGEEAGLNISTDPAQPPTPPVPAVETPLAPDPAPAPDTSAPTEETADPDPAATGSPDEAERPQVRRLIPDTPDTTNDTPTAETADLPRPAIGRPAASLTDRNPGNSARIPSISGDTAEAPTTAPADTPDADASLPPLRRFAVSVDSDPSLPQMSIVMIDDGTGPLGPETLDTFPFPVTFALDPGHPDAAARMSAYRALGYEVAALVELPPAAQPTDVEQILAGAVAALPEAVALIEAPGGNLQSVRDNTEQATSFAADSGHGLVFLPNGLNTAQAIARGEGVPAVSILRDFDGEGQDARTKRRFLDGAAFRARQDGSVVMLGRLTPDTLSALLLWSLQDRAASVAMVPVSAVLIDRSE